MRQYQVAAEAIRWDAVIETSDLHVGYNISRFSFSLASVFVDRTASGPAGDAVGAHLHTHILPSSASSQPRVCVFTHFCAQVKPSRVYT